MGTTPPSLSEQSRRRLYTVALIRQHQTRYSPTLYSRYQQAAFAHQQFPLSIGNQSFAGL
ncbi:hypothetical protein HMY34_14870 [Thiothrix subterranea]|uniref:hypothetical protein n=1 Tax=Thiothrix subterranea TaxID=2735563 RepID=UPI00192A9727|nr:hypothetical protein [Thiothrix subterranea]QQZ29938.1 hypothetical protein HMY34_14870 [Thiothrix subterranea]